MYVYIRLCVLCAYASLGIYMHVGLLCLCVTCLLVDACVNLRTVCGGIS
jgi:hypothetical protein